MIVSMKSKLLIIGASGHGKVVADIAIKMRKWKRISFLDDNPDKKSILGLDVIGSLENIIEYKDDYDMFVAIGNNSMRKKVSEILQELNITLPVLVHPSAIIGEEVKIGCGTVIMAGAIINSATTIGKGCIINTGSTVDHDNNLKDYVHISPGAHLAGTVTVGECSWLGIGSIVSNNINVVENCIIGAGSVVVNNVLESGVYVGAPAKKIR